MARVARQPEANLDLYNIWDYLAAESIERADKLIRRVDEVFHLLAENPEMGRSRSELAPGVRSFPVDSYIIFYQALSGKEGIEVVRVLHQRQDISGAFEL